MAKFQKYILKIDCLFAQFHEFIEQHKWSVNIKRYLHSISLF